MFMILIFQMSNEPETQGARDLGFGIRRGSDSGNGQQDHLRSSTHRIVTGKHEH